MNYIFVCKHGQHRSAIAARIAEKLLQEKYPNTPIETDYFGTDDALPNSEKIKILEQADKVFVMEPSMVFDIKKILRYQGPITILNIQDSQELKESDIEKILNQHLFPE